MDWLLPEYARRFVQADYAVFTFDYRYFGQSAGMPRQLVDVDRQREDIHAAIDYIKRNRRIDDSRIVLWGTSLGGGHVFHVASERADIAAVIAQAPAFDMISKKARGKIRLPAKAVVKVMGAALVDMMRGLAGLPPYYIKVFGTPEEAAVFQDPALKANFDALERRSKYWRNRFTPRFYFNLPRYQKSIAEDVTIPLLVCIAKNDVYSNPSFQRQVAEDTLSGRCMVYDADHFDFYHGIMDEVIDDQIGFLREKIGLYY
jgi:hypothetical protein